jgi:hypothetical protein
MDEMDVARVLLHKQTFMGNRLIAEVGGKFMSVIITVLFTM